MKMGEGLKLGIISMGSKSSVMLIEEAKKLFDEVVHIDLRKVEIKIDKKTEVLYDGELLKDFDCLLMKGSFRYANLLYGLTEAYKDKCFIPIDSNAHIIAHNKFMTHMVLSDSKLIKMPATFFTAKVTETKQFLKTLNYPIVLKFPNGTHGKGVIFSDSYASASSMIDALDIFKQPALIQDYIPVKSDIRVIVAGDKVIGSMKRIAKGDDIRANAHLGGDAIPFVVTPEIKAIALEASRKIKAGICAVDIIESDYGPLLLEVNTSPGLQKITEVTKKNIAYEMAEYLYNETKKYRDSKDKVQNRDMMLGLGVAEIGSRDFEAEVTVRNGRIILPEFVYNMSGIENGQTVTIKISKNKVEIVK